MSRSPDAHSLVFERVLPHPPEKVWRALTQSWLIEEWLMANDFVPEVGRRFTLRATPLPGWSGVTHCQVVAVEPPRLLVYHWGDGSESTSGLKTTVTWTLLPEGNGTRLLMEQSGFPSTSSLSYTRMSEAWRRFLYRLEIVAGAFAS